MVSPNEAWHEELRAEERPTCSSNRSFGITCAAIFALIGVLSLWHSHNGAWWLAFAALFAIAATSVPGVLSPINRVWAWVGGWLYLVVGPVVMVVLYFGAIVPVGLLMRAFGSDPLHMRLDRHAASYWVVRGEADRPQTMKNQS